MGKTWSSEIAVAMLVWVLIGVPLMFVFMPLDRLSVLEPMVNNLSMIILPVCFGALGFKRHVKRKERTDVPVDGESF